MPFNPRTFDLASRERHGRIWEAALERATDEPGAGLKARTDSRNEALALLHALNRWRKAYQVQNEGNDGDRYNHLDARVVDNMVVIRDRALTIPDYKLYDSATGEEVPLD